MANKSPEQHQLDLLREELRLAGVNTQEVFPRWADVPIMRDAILRELLIALVVPVHEGLIPPYGCVVAPDDAPFTRLLSLKEEDLPLARKAADGTSALVAFTGSRFAGLVLLDPTGSPELELVKLSTSLDGIAFRRNRNGMVRLYGNFGSLQHYGRRWSISPSLETAIGSVCRVASMVNPLRLRKLLEFAYHVLSPWNIGATLVWLLSDRDPFNSGIDLEALELSVNPNPDKPSLSFTAHLLAQYDGATIVRSDGTIKRTGIHLVTSKKAEDLISALPGTRHTSARRASYDFANAIIVTVSVDGPVTVFSDGLSVFALNWSSADALANVMDPKSWTQKRPFLRWWAALKMKENQCPKPARVTRPA